MKITLGINAERGNLGRGSAAAPKAGGTAGVKEGGVWSCFGTSAKTLSPHKLVHVRVSEEYFIGTQTVFSKSSARGFSHQHGVFDPQARKKLSRQPPAAAGRSCTLS